MNRYIAFLRGINLGKRRPAMSELKALFEKMGFAEVETFIASGNILFSSKVTDAGKLEAQIAKHLEAALGYDVDTFVRTAAEVVRANLSQLQKHHLGVFDDEQSAHAAYCEAARRLKGEFAKFD